MAPAHGAYGAPLRARVIAERFRKAFGGPPQLIVSAPGRVNLIGEHTDYSEGFVLPMAIDRRIQVAAAPSDDAELRLELEAAGDERARAGARRYVEAVFSMLRSVHPGIRGAELLITGGVPQGAGLSSSAALEIACARAAYALYDVAWDALGAARLAQRAENEVLGVRCGIMDQATSSAGRAGCALLIDCRSVQLSYVPVPREVSIVVMDTGTRRALGDTEYNARRAACEAATDVVRALDSSVRTLRDVTPELLERSAPRMDALVLRRARHVVTENQRPARMAAALAIRDFAEAGLLMNESHASLRDLYDVSSPHLDIACEIARAHPGCFGARLTGAGFGGCAIALVQSEATSDFIAATAPRYESRTYARSTFFGVAADDGASIDERPRQNR